MTHSRNNSGARGETKGIPSGLFYSRLRTKLLILVLLLFVPLFGLALYSHLQQRRLATENARDSALAMARLAAATQEQFIRNARQLLATLADLSFLALTTNVAFCETHLSNLTQLSPDYLTFGLIELDGRVCCSARSPDTPVSLGDRPYFTQVIQSKHFSIGEYQVGRLTGEPSLNFGHPVFDSNGSLQRVIFAALRLSLLSEAISRIPIPKDGAITVYDRNGTILARFPEPGNWVGKSVQDSELGRWVMRQKEGVAQLAGVDGITRLYAATPIIEGRMPGLFVTVGVPLNTSLAEANQELLRNAAILAAFAIALLAGAWLYSREYFLRPINALLESAQRITTGDLSTRSNLTRSVHELSVLGMAFDTMATTLERREKEIRHAHDTIADANTRLEQRVADRTTELRALNHELESFSYSVSHDLRAPLRHIAGFVNLLQEKAGGQLDEKCRRYLQIVSDSAHDMGRLIDDLLSFSRMSRAEMRTGECDLSAVVAEVTGDLAAEISGRDISLKIAQLPTVHADASLMRQVMQNLVSNALKYSRTREKAVIEIDCEVSAAGEDVIFVRDNGVGFDMKYADKLFGVFQRLHDASEFEGTGIGLAIVHRVIARHGGRTWAEAVVDQGATFFFALPRLETKQ